MSKAIITIGLFFVAISSKGQNYLTNPITGTPYMISLSSKYQEIQGSAWLYDDWKTSHVTDKHGTTHLNMQVRFDLYANKLYYNHNNTVYEFVTDVAEVELFPLIPGDTTNSIILKKGFAINKDITTATFVQVLAEGKVTFIKYLGKVVNESTEYNVPGKVKTFGSRNSFYYLKDGKIQSQKPGTKILEELTKDKWPEVDAYMNKNSLNAKDENDFAKAVNYYNSL